MSEVSRNPVRQALRALTHGVYVLGVQHAGRDDYLVVSLIAQCSVQPPRLSLAVSTNARILPAFRAAAGGALAILDDSQLAAVRRYGAPGGVRHEPQDVMRTSTMHPVVPEAQFVLNLSVLSEYAVGDHVLFVADVVDGSASAASNFAPLTLANTGFPYAG